MKKEEGKGEKMEVEKNMVSERMIM